MNSTNVFNAGSGATPRRGQPISPQQLLAEARRAASSSAAGARCIAWIEERLDSVRFGENGPPSGLLALREVSKSRKTLLFRCQQPSGRLQVVLQAGADPTTADSLSVERVGFAAARGEATARLRTDKSDPFIAVLCERYPHMKGAAVAPVMGKSHLWGAVASLYPHQPDFAHYALETVIAASEALSARLRAGGPRSGSPTVLDEQPRAALPIDDFYDRLELLLACAPSNGAGVALLAFVCGRDRDVDVRTSRGAFRVPQPIIDAFLGSLRVEDIAARIDGDSLIVALPNTPLASAEKVLHRLRTAVSRANVSAQGGAFALVRADARSKSARDVVESALAQAREKFISGK